MKDTRSVEEQVAELTEDQKNKIVSAYRWDTGCPILIFALSILLFMSFKENLVLNIVDKDVLFAVFGFIVMGLLLIGFVTFKIVVSITVPYYDKHKARYIIRLRSKMSR